jgi:hypothetical protein
MIGCSLIDFVGKLELPFFLLIKILTCPKLMFDRYNKVAILRDNLFHIESESIVRIDLLFDESILSKITIKHLPEVALFHPAIAHDQLNIIE